MENQSTPIALAISHIKKEIINTAYIFCMASSSKTLQTVSVFTSSEQADSKSLHYDLLIITSDECSCKPDFGNLKDILKDSLPGTELSINTFIHSLASVKEALAANNRFFHTVIEKAAVLYSKTPETLKDSKSVFDPEADQLYLQRCHTDYRNNLEQYAQFVFNSKNPNTYMAMVSKGIKEACKMLIEVIMGYQPNDCRLGHLLDICYSIDPRLREIVPVRTAQDRYHYQLILNGAWKRNQVEPIQAYVQKCLDDFIDLSQEICEARAGIPYEF